LITGVKNMNESISKTDFYQAAGIETINGISLYEAIKAAGIETDNRYGDLYFRELPTLT
jgi:hypothetical protein